MNLSIICILCLNKKKKNRLLHRYLRLLGGHAAHLLRVQLHRVVPQLGFSRRLQVVASHRQVAVSLYPPGRVDKEVGSQIGSAEMKGETVSRAAPTSSSPCGWPGWLCTRPGCPSGSRSPGACSARGVLLESPRKAWAASSGRRGRSSRRQMKTGEAKKLENPTHQSKKSPLYVTKMLGFVSWTWSNQRWIRAACRGMVELTCKKDESIGGVWKHSWNKWSL